jgi:ElaB/YqjD/DUF883 family membrane-anchored ribosome-binding protein
MEPNEFSTGDSTLGQSGGSTVGSGSSASFGSSDVDHALADRARSLAGNAQEKLADVGSAVRERAGTMKDSLADVLLSGADRLRHRSAVSVGTAQLTGATDAGSVAVENDSRRAPVTDRVATGMDATADWLRDADLKGLRTSIEGQVKQHPGRTLLIAVGVGYLLGKALRK